VEGEEVSACWAIEMSDIVEDLGGDMVVRDEVSAGRQGWLWLAGIPQWIESVVAGHSGMTVCCR